MTEIDLIADRSIKTTVTPAQKDVKPAGGPVILRSVETTRLSD
jgi:hypothetical protein